jgi:hypothetical protein
MLWRTERRWAGKFTALLAVAALVAGLMGTAPALAQATTMTTSQTTPIDTVIPNTCGGEEVHISGAVHELFHITDDASGGFHLAAELNFVGIRGEGLTSGVTYRWTGGAKISLTLSDAAEQETSLENFHLIGQGPANDQLVKLIVHFTFANGNLTADKIDFREVCK